MDETKVNRNKIIVRSEEFEDIDNTRIRLTTPSLNPLKFKLTYIKLGTGSYFTETGFPIMIVLISSKASFKKGSLAGITLSEICL